MDVTERQIDILNTSEDGVGNSTFIGHYTQERRTDNFQFRKIGHPRNEMKRKKEKKKKSQKTNRIYNIIYEAKSKSRHYAVHISFRFWRKLANTVLFMWNCSSDIQMQINIWQKRKSLHAKFNHIIGPICVYCQGAPRFGLTVVVCKNSLTLCVRPKRRAHGPEAGNSFSQPSSGWQIQGFSNSKQKYIHF